MRSIKKTLALTVSGAAVVTGGIVGVDMATSQAAGSGTVHTVRDPLTVRAKPTTHSRAVGALRKGTKVTIYCQQRGQRVTSPWGSTTWWDKIGTNRWVSDAYVSTGHRGRFTKLCNGSTGGDTGTGKMPGAPRANPYPPAMSRAPHLTKRAAFVRAEMQKAFPGIRCDVSAYRPGSKTDHNSGNALDCFPGRFGSFAKGANLKEGNTAAAWLRKYAGRLDVQYVIWQNRIWNMSRASEGWRDYGRPGQVTQGHYDHIHISVNAPVQH
ncbi:SH3 domain-containing protein [Calidifontibacter sp. DB0510]|uniref:SH3 domain-containing protein n=1 Tax=Metallococcus carri TaxID=1656884 RepID=A0A967B4G8_9MICO|nr:SH3 domain-containing protein [Metallococcus carri]NHN55452.1 SH3 domain-containing protein [Metallococcus carri]NOP38364.1 SH3 domain-containing protein [Calidifontibacter sp. DB2511S]